MIEKSCECKFKKIIAKIGPCTLCLRICYYFPNLLFRVDYVDADGKSRRCLRQDLEQLEKRTKK